MNDSSSSEFGAVILTEAQAANATVCQRCKHLTSIEYGYDVIHGLEVVDYCRGYGKNQELDIQLDPATGKIKRRYRVLVGSDRHDIVFTPYPRTFGLNDGKCPKYQKASWGCRLVRFVMGS